ncbi:MAG: DUF6894 family protein [Devosia sp.]
MPDFYFNIRGDSVVLKDLEGTSFPDLAAAHLEAISAIREILADLLTSGKMVDGQKMDICDSAGNILETIPFKAVLNLFG